MKKRYWLLVVFILITTMLFMSVVYALYTTSLYIYGSAAATPSSVKWEIKFANLSDPINTGNPSILAKPKLSDTAINDFKISFERLGQSIAYEFDIKNTGDFDAILSTVYKNEPVCVGTGDNKAEDEAIVCDNFRLSLKYKSNGQDVQSLDELNSGVTKRVILLLKYDGDQTPSEKVEITAINVSLIYIEKT